MMNYHNQDPALSSKKIARRANVVARITGMGLSLFGGELTAGTFAQPVAAGTEIASSHEANDSQATLVKKVNTEALSIQKAMFSKAKELPGKTASANGGIFYMSKPGSKAGHYDMLVGSLQRPSGGIEQLPYTLIVCVNSDSSNLTKMHHYDEAYQYIPAGTGTTKVTFDLWENTGGPHGPDKARYRVMGLGDNPGNYPVTHYAQNPSLVTKEVGKFLTEADTIAGLR